MQGSEPAVYALNLVSILFDSVRVGTSLMERIPCTSRMGALEKTIRGFAERDREEVIKSELGRHTTSTICIPGSTDSVLDTERAGSIPRSGKQSRKLFVDAW